MDYSKIITIEPGKRSGKPTIRETRMTVTDVLEYLAGGMSEEEILADFPDLTREDIKACLAFAADRVDVQWLEILDFQPSNPISSFLKLPFNEPVKPAAEFSPG